MSLIYCPTCNDKIEESLFNKEQAFGWPSVHPDYCRRWGIKDNEWPRKEDLPIKYEPIVYCEDSEENKKISENQIKLNDAVDNFVIEAMKI